MSTQKLVWIFLCIVLILTAGWFLREKQADTPVPVAVRLAAVAGNLQQGVRAYETGKFQIQWLANGQEHAGGDQGPQIVIIHKDMPGRWLWYSRQGEAFIAAGEGQETVTENRGSYWIRDQAIRSCTGQSIDAIERADDGVVIHGRLTCDAGAAVAYRLAFRAISERQLQFALTFADPAVNRAALIYASGPDEHFYGFGEQFSSLDHKGQLVPIWVSEQGIGRGAQPVTTLVNLAAKAGGNAYTTYAAAPQYLTSQVRSLFLENSQYARFDLRSADRVRVQVFSGSMTGRILYGPEPMDLISEYTYWAGRMRPLPNWILSGAVVGMQGGTRRVQDVYEQLQQHQAPIAAFWLQDWVGQRTTSFGKQLWWNWVLDEERYPAWEELRTELARDGIRLMVYASPFLVDTSEKPGGSRNLFREAKQQGFLVRAGDGEPYLVQNTDFSAGMVDLSNPAGREWYKSVLREEVIQKAGAAGWMADFGEALPYDAVLESGESAADFHNRYPEAWASLNREVIDEQVDGEDLVFFMRAASPRSPGYATLFWQGDQLVTWDEHDGLASAVTSLIGSGFSGMSLNHSDIGGYTAINNPLLHVLRSKELLLRWMDFAAFTTIYRTHEGNLPHKNAQFYSDDETLTHFARMAAVYKAWLPLRRKLVDEAARTGVPVARAVFLQYPDDPNTFTLATEYMLGADVLVAPVTSPGVSTWQVYLPAGDWVHLWSSTQYAFPYQGSWVTVDAPIGQPPVFYRLGSQDGIDLQQKLQDIGTISPE